MEFLVAIDGPAGSGKGTITKLVGEKLGLINIDTGAMFRCITLSIIRNKIKLDENDKIEKLLQNIKIESINENGIQKFLLNNEDVSKKIREKQVNELVSPVATLKIVRENLLKLQRRLAKNKKIIMEGRDIGTTVFPNANVKIYLDATPEERAKRRVKQNLENGIELSYEEVLKNVKTRDKIDSTREIAPLKKADDAIYIDSSNMTIDEVVNKIVKIIENNKTWKKED